MQLFQSIQPASAPASTPAHVPFRPPAPAHVPGQSLGRIGGWLVGVVSMLMLLVWGVGGRSDEPGRAGPGIAATSVRLPDLQTTLGEACAELTRQTGAKFSLERADPTTPIRLTKHDWTFWQAVQALADQANARVVVNAEAISLIATPADAPPLPVSLAGAFRVSVRQALARRDFDTASHTLEVTLEVACEPKFRPFLASANAIVQSVRAEPAHAVELPKQPRALVPAERGVFTVRVGLAGLPRRVETLDLQGSLAVVGTDTVETYRFDQLAPGAKQTSKAGVTCTISKLEKRGRDYLITIEQVGGQALYRFESFQESLVESECRVVGPKGQVIRANEDSSITRGDRTTRRYRLTLPVEAGLEGCRLELTTPQHIREVEVPFELRGIPLP
jgi:hypothetical protein